MCEYVIAIPQYYIKELGWKLNFHHSFGAILKIESVKLIRYHDRELQWTTITITIVNQTNDNIKLSSSPNAMTQKI